MQMVPVARQQGISRPALVKHISSDGCQLVLGAGAAQAGERFCFALGGYGLVTGTVRWALGGRAGFAFDLPLCDDSRQVLGRLAVEPLELVIDTEPGNALAG